MESHKRNEEKLTEELEALRQENRRLESVLSVLPHASVVIYDPDGAPLESWGSAAETAPAVPADLEQQLRADVRTVIESGEPVRRVALGSDSVERTLAPLRSEDGDVVAVVGLQTERSLSNPETTGPSVSEKRFQQLSKISGALITDIGPDGLIRYASENHEEILGYGPDEIVGRELQELHRMFKVRNPEDVPLSRLTPEDLERFGEFRPVIRVGRRDGRDRWLELEVNTYETPEGIHALAVSQDVTARVSAELALRASEANLRAAQRIANLGCWEWYPDTNHVELSDECRALFGIGEEAPPTGLAFDDSVHPDDLTRYRNAIRDAFESGHFDIEMRLIDRTGAERVIHSRGELERIDGKPRRMLGTVHDITELRNAERVARRSQRRLRQILTSLPGTQVVVWGPDGRSRAVYTGVSQDTYGLSADRAVGALAGEFLPDERRPIGLQNVLSVFETGNTFQTREEVLLPAGNFIFDVSFSPLRNSSGETTHALTVCHDVTDRVRQEEEQARLKTRVEASDRLESLGLLAGGVAHDFNNLLVGILGNTEIALAQTEPDSQLHRLLDAIHRASEHASDLTDQLLAYAGKGQLEASPVELQALVRGMDGLLRASLGNRSRLRIEGGNEAIWVRADTVQLRQIVMNLVMNAKEATEHEEEIVVRTGSFEADASYLGDCLPAAALEPGRYAFLEVRDHGGGISENAKSLIFDPFYTTKFKGRGLGLSAVMGIVKAHGGALRLESAPGHGTVFRVIFPLTLAPLSSSRAQEDGNWRGAGTILVVDDSETVRDVASAALELNGFTPLLASSGAQAVDVLRSSKDEVVAVLLDLTMPGMDGVQTFHALRGLSGIPVLFMTGYSDERITDRIGQEEGVGCIHKPFSVASLRRELRSLLAD